MNPTSTDEISINGVKVSTDSMLETLLQMEDAVENELQLVQHWVCADVFPLLKKNPEIKSALADCDLVHSNCGLFCLFSSWRTGKVLPNVSSNVLISNFLKLVEDSNYRVFFLGNRYELVSNLSAHYSKKLSQRVIAGFHHGNFTPHQEADIAKQVADSGAQIVITDLDVATQTRFVANHPKLLRRVNVFTGHSGIFEKLAKQENVFKQCKASEFWEKVKTIKSALNHTALLSKFKAAACLMGDAIHGELN